jgi:hypothetical protein
MAARDSIGAPVNSGAISSGAAGDSKEKCCQTAPTFVTGGGGVTVVVVGYSSNLVVSSWLTANREELAAPTELRSPSVC